MRWLSLGVLLALASATGLRAKVPDGYSGRPFQDDYHQMGPAKIPGVLQCAYYDLGGAGIAYRDTTPANEGSGILNRDPAHQRPHAGEYLWHFREGEGVDLSYVKDITDLNHASPMAPAINQFFIGWTEEGEWTNYTVNVLQPGTYRIFALYAHQANTVFFDLNGKRAVECRLPRATGDWYVWDYAEIGKITFPEAGLQLLTFHYGRGNNFASFTFVKE